MNGCHNRGKFSAYSRVQDGWTDHGVKAMRTPRMRPIPFTMTTDCQYTLSDLGQKDTGCVGCKHRKEKTT